MLVEISFSERYSAAPCGSVKQMVSKNRITVNLTESEFEQLGILAKQSKVSKAWLGRHAISDLLERAKSNDPQLRLPLLDLKRKDSQ